MPAAFQNHTPIAWRRVLRNLPHDPPRRHDIACFAGSFGRERHQERTTPCWVGVNRGSKRTGKNKTEQMTKSEAPWVEPHLRCPQDGRSFFNRSRRRSRSLHLLFNLRRTQRRVASLAGAPADRAQRVVPQDQVAGGCAIADLPTDCPEPVSGPFPAAARPAPRSSDG